VIFFFFICNLLGDLRNNNKIISEILYEKVGYSRRLEYKSRIVVSPRVLTKRHHSSLLKYPLGCTRTNNNKRNAFICFPLISGGRESGQQVRAGSFLEQWLVIEPIPF